MTFGLTVTNDSSYIQIDSETPRLCAIYSGTYSSSSYISTTVFPEPITTPEPPCIFIRNSQARPGDLYTNITILGVSGGWTGFRITALNIDMRPAGKWFCAVFAAKATSKYGLRMWSESEDVIYDSGTVPVIFTRANHSWTFMGKVVLNPITNGYYWRNNLTGQMLEDEYFMINPFSRGLLEPSYQGWTPIGVRFNYSENRLQVFGITAGGTWSNMGQPAAVFARLPGT